LVLLDLPLLELLLGLLLLQFCPMPSTLFVLLLHALTETRILRLLLLLADPGLIYLLLLLPSGFNLLGLLLLLLLNALLHCGTIGFLLSTPIIPLLLSRFGVAAVTALLVVL
jgi:hypothetical protein